jgi:hypothetical protein
MRTQPGNVFACLFLTMGAFLNKSPPASLNARSGGTAYFRGKKEGQNLFQQSDGYFLILFSKRNGF